MNTFDWIEIRTEDIQKSALFYETLFGWKIIEQETIEGSELRIYDTGGAPRVENLRRLGIWARPMGELQGILAYIVVEDMDNMLLRVAELGGRVITAKGDVGGGYTALVTDPCGNHFGLYQDKPRK